MFGEGLAEQSGVAERPRRGRDFSRRATLNFLFNCQAYPAACQAIYRNLTLSAGKD
jgi:hypothetical protein